MKEYLPVIMAILVMLFVFLMLWLVSLHGKSKEDFPFGGENDRYWNESQSNSQEIKLDSVNAEKLRRLNEAVSNWDNETTGY